MLHHRPAVRNSSPLKKRISDLEKARSRSPRRSNQKQITAPGGSQMLALPAPSAPAQKGGKGEDRRLNKRRGGAGRRFWQRVQAKGEGHGSKDFDFIMRLPPRVSCRIFTRSSIKTRSATSSRSMLANFLTTNASSRTCVRGLRRFEALRRLQMPHFENPLNLIIDISLIEVPAVPSPMPVSPVTPIVKPRGGQRRVLL